MQYKGFRHALLSTARNILHHDELLLFAPLRKKSVLLIWGKHDRSIPRAEIDSLRTLIRPEFLLVDSAGHLPSYEQPQIVNSRILDFLKKGHSPQNGR
jgi:pimeloyl-ACP methyl ester carboxylesterase